MSYRLGNISGWGNTMNRKRGFTLVEMLVVVGIIAALAAIAVPAYSKYVERSRRIEGKTLANSIAQRQERFFSTYNRYSANLVGTGVNGLGMIANCGASIGSENCYYTAALVVPAGGASYTIQVQPRTGTAQTRDKCGRLSLTSTGSKTYAGNESNGKCW